MTKKEHKSMLKFNEYLINKDKIIFIKFLQLERTDNSEKGYEIVINLVDGERITRFTKDKSEIENWREYFYSNI